MSLNVMPGVTITKIKIELPLLVTLNEPKWSIPNNSNDPDGRDIGRIFPVGSQWGVCGADKAHFTSHTLRNSLPILPTNDFVSISPFFSRHPDYLYIAHRGTHAIHPD